ncbi:hypothetical protein FLK61_26240 [Paenalkalicoccus suaedae]|uniref:IraD/Gp25-like domain-containing protein n=1 Tax=Paenalkalicoccus suaedae TaxID=2592382 RepID=A0A859FAE1_9BACI|nr:hypothetical protein [Paenalkalicoccus suaedae]QKS70263.1 hypothetical protein FLK61_26240 [Paenalkalicoccus suaedae]
MIDYDNVTIEVNFGANGSDEVIQNLHMLFTTPIGTVPLDREFGIDTSFLDQPINVAQALLRAEYANKTEIYEPRAFVTEVQFESDIKGNLIPKVVIDVDLEAD